MSWVRQVWWRLGLTDAISWPTFWATFIAGLVGGFASSSASGAFSLRLAIIVMGQVLLWIPLLLAWLAMRREPQRSRPGLVLAAFFIGAFFRALATSWALYLAFGAQEVAPVNRITGIFLNLLPVFVVTAVVVSLLRERRRQISELNTAQVAMQRSYAEVEQALEVRNTQAADRVRGILEGELAQLEGAKAAESLAILQRTVTDLVRPMSHELAHSLPKPPDDMGRPPNAAVPWSHVLDAAASGRPFRPLLVGAFFAFLIVVLAFRRPEDAWTFAAFDVMLVIGLFLANRVVEWASPRVSRPTRILIASLAGVTPGLAVALLVPFVLGTTFSDLGVALGFALLATGATLGSSLLTALLRQSEEVIEELTQVSASLERALVRQRQVEWYQQRALSRALHGPVQMAVTAAAIRIDAAMRTSTVSPDLVDQIRRELVVSLDVLHEADGEVITFGRGLERMRATWEGVCGISDDVTSMAETALAGDGVLRAIVIDITTEAVSNAVWHGEAARAGIRVDVVGDDREELLIEVTTDGRGGEEPKRRGLGTELLDECTLRWHREAGVDGDLLVAVLPFGGR